MKINNVIVAISIIISILMLQNCKSDTRLKEEPAFALNTEFLNILNRFISSISHADSTSIFVIIKNIDANTAKYYVVAKKPLRTDFAVIGMPLTSIKIDEKNIYFFNGIEKIINQGTLFWEEHSEIFDDRRKQVLGIYETPIIKKELYLYDNHIWQREGQFDDMIFIGNPTDTISFRQNK